MKLFICLLALVASTMSSDSDELLKQSNDQFTAKMFQKVVKLNPGKSMVMSAFSVLSPLAQLALASEGDPHDEILRAIGLPNDTVTKQVFLDSNKELRSLSSVELKLANRVYVREGGELNPEYAAVSRDVFNSDVKNVDFAKNTEAAKEINTWVEEATNNRIKDLVSPNSLNANTAVVLVNAIYFKGKWVSQFSKEDTKDRDFSVSKDKTISLPTMKQSAYFNYGESQELDAKLLEMPYEGDKSSLLIVLPNEIDGLDSLLNKLKDPAVLRKAVDSMYNAKVDVSMPKFKIETKIDLADVLKKMNIEKLFTPGQARLDKLLKESQNLFVSGATQKAYIDVNEEGAEAAAANEFGIAYLSAMIPEQLTFNADHPFVFFLMERNNILFSGVIQS
ncbi:antichymotrypsin-2-like isoform X2 [Helicoverpa zea]|uniref:antichymotrypsin-2-like isoform X2 n=1 Tax=Helicoverpa zea TaxID=7113 RepID=UPI001F5A80C6|nr:antichymotrypsin-2-like isoform X2 [Helicoverpa zea]